jgi:Ca2+-binding EF-hand superfamily protein
MRPSERARSAKSGDNSGAHRPNKENRTMAQLSSDQLAELRETFDYNDRDGDGRIQLDEFVEMLDELESDISEREAKVGFADIDTNDDGLIDFEEFVRWWTDESTPEAD